MSNESTSDVYRSFGVNPTVLTNDNVQEHEQNMLALNVRCRDNDDEIVTTNEDDNQDDDDDIVRVKVSSEENNQLTDESDGDNEDLPDGEDWETDGDFDAEPLGEATEELKETISVLESHEKGFEQAVNQAAEAGLSSDVIERIQREYNDNDELSEQSFKELESVGYSRDFVESYIRGQEALVNQYVNEIKQYAGGEESFANMYAHLEASNPNAAESLISAIQNRDIGTIQTIINLAKASRSQKFGKPATRSVAAQAKQAAPVVKKQVGFTSQAEMIQAMSDRRYSTDPVYRAEVERKTYYSNFNY